MLIVVRRIVLSLLLGGTVVFGILPICMRARLNSCRCSGIHHKSCATKKQRLATCFLIFFGGGVLLSTCLVRLFHEVREKFEEITDICLQVEKNHSKDHHAYHVNTAVQNDVAIRQNNNLNEIMNSKDTTVESLRYKQRNESSQNYGMKTEKESLDSSILCRYIANTSFPFPEFITACGFFLIYFMEELIKSIIRCYHSSISKSFDISSSENGCNTKKDNLILKEVRKISITDLENASSLNEIPLNTNKTAIKNTIFKYSQNSLGSLGIKEFKKSVKNLNFFYGYSDMKELNIEGLDDFITILALSFNSIFEGFAVGFQHTEISTWMLFFSIALHKYVSVFVISLETLSKGGSNLRVISYVAIFSFMSPVGMLAAMLTHENLIDTKNFEIIILNSISVGTLLYVTFYEMLKQRKDYVEISGFAQFFVLLVGFIVMSVIEYFYTYVE